MNKEEIAQQRKESGERIAAWAEGYSQGIEVARQEIRTEAALHDAWSPIGGLLGGLEAKLSLLQRRTQ